MKDSTKVQAKGIPNGKEPKENQNNFEGTSNSKKNKKLENKKCPYCMRGFHPEDSCMRKTLDQMKALCV